MTITAGYPGAGLAPYSTNWVNERCAVQSPSEAGQSQASVGSDETSGDRFDKKSLQSGPGRNDVLLMCRTTGFSLEFGAEQLEVF